MLQVLFFHHAFPAEEGSDDTRKNSNNIGKNYCRDGERRRMTFVMNYLKFLHFQYDYMFFGSIEA